MPDMYVTHTQKAWPKPSRIKKISKKKMIITFQQRLLLPAYSHVKTCIHALQPGKQRAFSSSPHTNTTSYMQPLQYVYTIYIPSNMCTRISAYTDTHPHLHTYTHSHLHTHTFTYTHVHTYTHTHTHTHLHTHIFTHTHTHIHLHTHTHLHTYTHTHLHKHTNSQKNILHTYTLTHTNM